MALVINNNSLATKTANQLSGTYAQLARSTQRLSSGLRISSAADDAAGLAIRELMRSDITALRQGMRNTNDAISMLQTADGALSIIDEKLIRMKELAEQAATGTYDSVQRAMIDSEFQAMANEIERIARATDFNGIKILDGNFTTSSSTTGTGSDGGNYQVTISPSGYVSESYSDRAALPQGTTEFVITNSKYAYFDGTNNALAITVGSDAPLDSETYNILWNGSTWVIEGKTALASSDNFYDISEDNRGDYYAVRSNNSTIMVWSGGSLKSFTVSLKDSYGNDVTNNATALSEILGKTATVKIGEMTSSSPPSFTMKSGVGTLVQPDPTNPSDTTLKIDLGNGNELTKANATTLGVIKFSLNVREVTDENGVSEPIPDSVVKIHFGPGNDKSEDYYYINKSNATLDGLELKYLSVDTQEHAQKALKRIDNAIVKKDQIRAYYGAMQNRLENTMTNLSVQSDNLQSAESRISDADIALEMMNFVKNQILTQSAVAMLAQANSLPQMALRLIGG